MPFLSIESLDVRQIGTLSSAHFVRGPILEGIIGRSIYRVPNDSSRRIWFRRTLPCNQVHTNKQAKKDHANQGKLDKFLLS